MKPLLTLLFCLFSISQLNSQVEYKDFLAEEKVSRQSEIGSNLIERYRVDDLDSLKIISIDLIEIGKRNQNEYCLAKGFFGFGVYNVLAGSEEAGVSSLKKALEYFRSKEDWSMVSQIFKDIGNGHLVEGEYYNAIELFKTSIDFGKLSNEPTDIFNGEIGLAECYLSLGDTVKGYSFLLSFKKKAIKYHRFEAASIAAARLSTLEQDSDHLYESMLYLKESIQLGGKLKSKLQKSNCITNKAILYFNMGKIDSSLICFNEALKIKSELNRPKQISEAYFNLSSYYILIGDLEEAEIMVSKSIETAKNNGFIIEEYDGVELLLYINKELNEESEILKAKEILKGLSDQLEKNKKIDSNLMAYVNGIKTEKVKKGTEKNTSSSYMWFFLLLPLVLLFAKRGGD